MAPLEQATVAAFLAEHLGGPITELAPIGQGDWSQAFAFVHNGGALVARFGAHPEAYEKDRFAARFATLGLPIPAVREIGPALDRWLCLSERAFGTIWDGVDAAQWQGLVPAVCRLLDALRRADLTGTRGYGGWDGSGDAPHRTWQSYLQAIETEHLPGWREFLAGFPEAVAVWEEGLRYLQHNAARCPNERYLIHNDLLHFNVLAAGTDISAVVDWGCGLYGDFLYDLAMFTFYSSWYPAMAGIDWASEVSAYFDQQGVALPQFDLRLRCCEIHLGLGNLAYSAFTCREGDLRDNAQRLASRLAG